MQFAGNGADDPAHPPLYDREVFAFLPYQTSDSSFAVFYYVVTRNAAYVYNSSLSGGPQYDMPPELFAVQVVWSEYFPRITDAITVERQLKGWSRAKKEALVRGDWGDIQRRAKRRGGKARAE